MKHLLFVRLYFFPYGIPLTEDGLYYFRYAADTNVLGHLPDRDISNNGWPLFVSLFFFFVHSNNFLDYMTIQRLISVSVSVFTIIPVYLLVCRFFDKKYGLIGALLFAFEPRIIQNSLLGITDTLYIFLVTLSLAFFLDSKKNSKYLSFCFAALATVIRYEGIMLFFVISIMFFVLQKRDYRLVKQYCVVLGIFILTISPPLYSRMVTVGNDGITNSIFSGGEMYVIEATSNQENEIIGIINYVKLGFENLFKFLGWGMIPYFIILVPPGVYWVFKNKDHNKITVIVSIIILSIPAFYAYSRGIQETRYLYVLYPLLTILSVFTIKFLHDRTNRKIIFIIIAGMILSSIGFIEYKKVDYEHEREAFEIAKHVSRITNVINEYYPESKYVRVTGMTDNFPVLSDAVSFGPTVLPTNYNTLEEFISEGRKENLDHIVVDDLSHRAKFLNYVFNDDIEYPYLIKVFDSHDFGYKYHVKIYKIDFKKFDLLKN